MRGKTNLVRWLLCVLFLTWPAQAQYGGGSGTAEDPYLIDTAEQMNAIGAEPNDWDKHFKLVADIDLKDFGGSSFNLIGGDSHPFKGVFDGNGHTISNLTYVVTGNEELADDNFITGFGLFRYIDDPNTVIKDLGLVNPDLRPASTCQKRVQDVGALVGSLSSGSISNCSIEGGQVQGERMVGGLAGSNYGIISDCYTTCIVGPAEERLPASGNASLDRREFFGGLVGINSGEISSCYAVGEVSGERKVGGLVGEDLGMISNSWSGSEVSGDVDIGGLVGKNRYTSVLSNCYATGHVSGSKSIGGLVGYCKNSSIDNCYATGSVSAEERGGGLVGLNEGTVTACYSTASVSADSDTAGGLVGLNGGTIFTSLACGDVSGRSDIGGLVGENRKWRQIIADILLEYDGIVINSYAKGSVYGEDGVGGLIGTNSGTVLRCYSIGRVTGEKNFGGLVGINGEIPVMGSFWDTVTSCLDTSEGGTGKTTNEMHTPSTFLEAGWDFVDETENGTEDTWWIDEGKEYPRLWWEIPVKYGGGTGEPNDPYLIYTAEQMNTIGTEPNDWDNHFKLMDDIDLSIYTGTDFNIIGNGLFPAFTGVFDGNGYTISNFTYSSTGETCIGIFGYVYGPNARIINVGLIDPNVDGGTAAGVGSLAGWIDLGTVTNCHVVGGRVIGKQLVGGLIGTSAVITDCYAVGGRVIAEGSAGCLVGRNGGSMINCYATGNITGSYRVGGLVGTNDGSIIDSYSYAIVEGRDAVGGLVGYNWGSLKCCFSTSSVTGKNSTGGLVGENKASVINCYCSCTLDAQDQVGGLVGINDGIITASYSSAGVQGQNEVGGLVGYNTDDGEIVNCYANGDVIGQRYVGGLVGNNATGGGHGGGLRSGTIRNCYSVTLVSGDQNIGGLVGYYGDDGVSGSFWDIEASGQTTSDGGVGKTALEMQDPNTFIDAGWDFAGAPGGPGDIWTEPEGGGYPVLMWQVSPPPELPAFSGGTGAPDDPYLISTPNELNSIGHNPRLMTAHFKLVNDIDLTGVDFYIIASQYYPYRGTFDGDGYTISNFSYTSPGATGVGLFGYVAGGQIKNLGLIAPNVHVDKGDFHGCLVGLLAAGIITHCYVESGSITGQGELGGLVGENGSGGAIMNCYFTGDATGKENVGGLVGQNRGSATASYSYANVEGRIAVGGLVGRCSPGETVNCYARGNVVGQWYVGGLVGSNGSGTRSRTGAIRNCYSASAVLEGSQNGGLLGADWGGEVRDSFWDIETSGRTTSHGGEGKTTAEMQSAGTFLDAGWDFAGETENGTEDIWWILEGQDYPHLWWESAQDGE